MAAMQCMVDPSVCRPARCDVTFVQLGEWFPAPEHVEESAENSGVSSAQYEPSFQHWGFGYGTDVNRHDNQRYHRNPETTEALHRPTSRLLHCC